MTNWPRKIYWNLFTLWHARGESRFPYLPLDKILAIQNRRVRAIVSHAYETTPYYRRVMDATGLRPRDFQTAGDLAKLPILTGDEVARAPEQFLSCQYAGGRSLSLQTTGTSGLSKTVYYNPASLFLSLANGQRQRAVLAQFVGRMVGYRELVVARSDSVSVRLRNFYRANSWTPAGIDLRRDLLIPRGNFEENVQQINDFKPDVIFGYGAYTGAIFRWAWEHSAPLFRPRAVWYSSERMAAADQRLIQFDFGVPVFSTYQAIEALRIAFQCEQCKGFHVNLDQVAVRVVDQDGNTLGPGGVGEIVISNLTNRATVLLNYNLGDVVSLGRQCSCGRSLPTIDRIEGRADDLIIRPGGHKIYASIIHENLTRVAGVVQVQVVQQDLEQFLVRVVCAGGTEWERARGELDAAMRSALGAGLLVQMERVDAIPPEPGGKVRAAISMVEGA